MSDAEIDICNAALMRAGSPHLIQDLGEGSKEALYCKAIFNKSRRIVLAAHTWDCATFREACSPCDKRPLADYQFCYLIPQTRPVIRIVQLDKSFHEYHWRVEGIHILTDAHECIATYIGDVSEPGQLSPWVIEAWTAKMAADLTYPLVRSRTKAQDEEMRYQQVLLDMIANDGTQGSNAKQLKVSALERVRLQSY